MIKMELVTRREDLAGLAERWDELANAEPRDAFFRSAGWYSSWLEDIRPDAEPFVVVARDSAGEIVGLAPLCRLKYRDHWLPMDAISSGGREVVSGDYLDYLTVPHARAEVLPSLLDFLWDVRSRWGLLVVGEVFEDGDLHCEIKTFCNRRGLGFRQQEERICPYIELPPTFDEYMATFSRKRRKEIKRQSRVMLEQFGATVEVHATPELVVANLDSLMRLHTDRWQSANQTGNMVRPGFARFLNRVCAGPPGGATPRLYLMKQEQKPVAALLVFHSGPSALAYSIGRDPNCAISHLSPGFALLFSSIKDAIEQGLHYYDFLRGDEGHKTHLTKSARKTVTLLVGRSLSANAYLRALNLKDAVKRRFPEWWDRRITAGEQRAPAPVEGEEDAAGEALPINSDATV